jgi:DNA-binding GntR family transcriptional regulator
MRQPLVFRTKADIVYEKLREQILSGELQPGDRVPINHVARALGVSDIPAREGVKRLEADGLLSFTTHKGAIVAQMGHHEVEELFAIRTELEALALRQAAARITPAELSELRSILDAMAEAERDGNALEYGRLNREFHLRAYAAQPYKKLCSMIESLWDSSDWCRRIFKAEAASLRASLGEHEAIYEALARGDGEAASVFLRAQKHRAAAWLLDHIQASEPNGAASAADTAESCRRARDRRPSAPPRARRARARAGTPPGCRRSRRSAAAACRSRRSVRRARGSGRRPCRANRRARRSARASAA